MTRRRPLRIVAALLVGLSVAAGSALATGPGLHSSFRGGGDGGGSAPPPPPKPLILWVTAASLTGTNDGAARSTAVYGTDVAVSVLTYVQETSSGNGLRAASWTLPAIPMASVTIGWYPVSNSAGGNVHWYFKLQEYDVGSGARGLDPPVMCASATAVAAQPTTAQVATATTVSLSCTPSANAFALLLTVGRDSLAADDTSTIDVAIVAVTVTPQ